MLRERERKREREREREKERILIQHVNLKETKKKLNEFIKRKKN